MSTALIVLGGTAFIGLSIFFEVTPKLRVLVGLFVGSKIAGSTVTSLNGWIAKSCAKIADPLGKLIGQSKGSVTLAIPSVLALIFGIIIAAFIFGTKSKGKSKGKGNNQMALVALACAIILPIVVGGLDAALEVTP